MSDLAAARTLMAASLAFHIVFAVLGIGMPLLMFAAEGMWLRTRDETYRTLAKTWAKAFAALFAVGAVSGTVLSFALGLYWPRFMEFAGEIVGIAFAIEGFVFFIETIFVGIYLYGWKRLSPVLHWLSALPIALASAASGILIVSVNAWMNTPAGFRLEDGRAVDINPWQAIANPAWFQQALHMILAAYVATGFAVAAVYAVALLRGHVTRYNLRALTLAMVMGAVAIPLQMVSGDLSARFVAENEPVKFAAMEGQWETERGAPLRVGGVPDMETGETRYAVEIPKALSLLGFWNPDAEVAGLNDVEPSERPNATLVHLAFQVMVGSGVALLGVAAWFWVSLWRRRIPSARWLLRALVASGPLGFLALQAGWIVTEVGRQPWVVQGVMRVEEGVTEAPGAGVALVSFSLVYSALAVILVWLLRRITHREATMRPIGGALVEGLR